MDQERMGFSAWSSIAGTTLTLTVEWQEWHLACKNSCLNSGKEKKAT